MEVWNLLLVAGISVGGMVACTFLARMKRLRSMRIYDRSGHYGIADSSSLVPAEIFNFAILFTIQ